MIWLYVAEVVLVVMCAALVPRMKRAGEREWNRYRREQIAEAIRQMMAAVTRSMKVLTAEMQKLGPALRKTYDKLNALTYALYGIEQPKDKR